MITGLDLVGAAMHNRFVAEDKPGATMRRGANYSTWWNGGLRTTVYFHNMIGLLTETIGNPTPMRDPVRARAPAAERRSAVPIAPQTWHFRQSVDYSITANRAVLDFASRHRETFLFNICEMGKDSIEQGSTDTWTMYPRRTAGGEGRRSLGRRRPRAEAATRAWCRAAWRATPCRWPSTSAAEASPEWRDPRAYVLPADQPDFLTADQVRQRAAQDRRGRASRHGAVQRGGKQYPAGSYVVKTAQAFRPHVLDMFEPQDHPNDFQFPAARRSRLMTTPAGRSPIRWA